MRVLQLFVASTALAAVTPATAANLLINGSFENGFSGWTLGGTSGDGFPPVVIPYNSTSGYPGGAFGEAIPADNNAANPGFDPVGNNAAYFVADLANPQTLEQAITVVNGVNYTFGFDVYLPQNGFNNVNDATFTATVGGLTFASFTASSQPATTWLHFSSAATANCTTCTGTFVFSFTSNGIPAKDFVIDRVYLAPTSTVNPVPEPATWAMMIAGFGVIGGAMRRRRSARVSFA